MSSGAGAPTPELGFGAASLYRSHYKYQFQIIDHKRIYYFERRGRDMGGLVAWDTPFIVDFLLSCVRHKFRGPHQRSRNINIEQECTVSDLCVFMWSQGMYLNHRRARRTNVIFIL